MVSIHDIFYLRTTMELGRALDEDTDEVEIHTHTAITWPESTVFPNV